MSLNHSVIMGRLTRDPELRRTQSGNAVASFTLAVDRDYTSANGDRETDFLTVVAWRGTAEFVSKYFTKGSMAVVSGRLQTRRWEDKDGNKRSSTEIVADNVYFGEAKRRDSEAEYAAAEREGKTGNYGDNPRPDFETVEDDGDLPF